MNRYDNDDDGWGTRDFITCIVIPFAVAFICVQIFHAIGQ